MGFLGLGKVIIENEEFFFWEMMQKSLSFELSKLLSKYFELSNPQKRI